jgi:hypothetical protein
MKKLITSLCALALGVGLLAGCTERSDRISREDRTTAPSASPSMSPRDTTSPPPTLPPPSTPSTAPSATPSSPSTGSSDATK